MVASFQSIDRPMRKSLILAPLLALALASLLFMSVSSFGDRAVGLSLSAPTTCPSGGCAAGQRLNFKVEFSVTPLFSSSPNTQVCVYAPADGHSGAGTQPWADASSGWISTTGIQSGVTYTSGETASVCTDNANSDDFLLGAYTTHTASVIDQLEFAFHIAPTTDQPGKITVKVFELDDFGNVVATQSYEKNIPVAVAAMATTVYVAETEALCGTFDPCYINSGDDEPAGLGTGLRDAVLALDAGGEIVILSDYPIKANSVHIDKALTIRGYQNARITYNGSACNEPMLSVLAGATLKDLTINDGLCVSPSRNLIEVNSAGDVAIENNTLNNGHRAIHVLDNTGNVTVAFNQIANNLDYAVYRNPGSGSGSVAIFANNMMDNRSGVQVNCNNLGTANHNFWGEGISATGSASNCYVTNGKRLGAPILLNSGAAGVQAIRHTVTLTKTSAFNGKISLQRSSGSDDYNVIIVNHGQGGEDNVPFLNAGTEPIEACSNFYDIFLDKGAVASDLSLSFKYDLNSSCINTIESSSYCGQTTNPELYPLWWHDPANNITNGWAQTGRPGGQTTVCDMANDQITVTINNAVGRPGLSNDLNYTPFVVGLPIDDGVSLSQFTATFNVTENNLRWTTTSETNVRGFHILRSNTQTGTYTRISPLIPAIGDTYIGGIYRYTDDDITYTRTYYYKLEVINDYGASIETYGPVSVLTATATPTRTQTRTPTLTRTATPVYYRSPTSYYRASTATPSGPTQVRTYGPTPTGTAGTKPAFEPTSEQDPAYPPDSGYPNDEDYENGGEGYPVTGERETPDASPPGQTDQTGTKGAPPATDTETQGPGRPIQWVYLLLGAVSGLAFLGAGSVILIKTRLQ